MFKKNSYGYVEYFVNDNHMKKLYNMYIHKTVYDKIMDILVLSAIIFTVVGIVLELTIDVDNTILHIIHSLSTIIIAIFALELLREYVKSKTSREFFRKHWIDFILVVFLSFYFLFMNYFGFAKIHQLTKAKSAVTEFKHAKIMFKVFKKLIFR